MISFDCDQLTFNLAFPVNRLAVNVKHQLFIIIQLNDVTAT